MENTLIIEIDGDSIEKEKIDLAAKTLRRGGTVAFPTETVYGLGANGLDPQAIEKIYIAKGRPSDNPLILHISKKEDVIPLVEEIPPIGEKIMEKFWPGPLTIIFKKSSLVPKEITGGLNTVAIRMPSHPVARALIEKAGIPIAAPSANLSGKPSPTKSEHVVMDLMGRVDMILKGENSDIGLESTVLDITTPIPMILRPGGITLEDLQEVLGNIEIDPTILETLGKDAKAKSPGMKYTHYAPQAPMTIIQGPTKSVVRELNKRAIKFESQGKRVGILATDETKGHYTKGVVLSVGKRDNPQSIAANFFDILRQFDEKKVDMILAEGIEDKGLGLAVINRMIKAAGHRIIHVKK